jgi:uncharacterized membrane protein YjjB (DUF3815 family)
MHPFTIILGILLGSLVAIAFGLAVVGFIFWLIQGESPRVAQEMPMLLRSASIFTALAAAAAWGFLGTLRRRRWRYPVLAVLWAGLVAAGWYYWP